MPYSTFQKPGERLAVGLCPCGDFLALAVADPHGHPFDLEPALLDRATAAHLRDAISMWLDGEEDTR
jgi:hypothetical protein